MVRDVVVELWTGAQIVRRLGPDDVNPTQAELDEIAVAFIGPNDGAMPTCRVMQRFGLPTGLGAPGSVPRG